jgi:putative Holliday junction resolvase
MRALGIDFGRRRIGLAVSDPTNVVATPLDTLQRRARKRPPLAKIAEIGREHGVDQLVIGLPLGLDGRETEWCAEVRDMGEKLAHRLGAKVSFVDERLTSVRAGKAVRSMGLSKKERERKERVDAAAAQLILQAWLDQPDIAR